MNEPYDPLSYDNLARSVVSALMEREPEALPPSVSFKGPGVYAIYYLGSFPPYREIASHACDCPIYVGKAIPLGARKGLSDVHIVGNDLFRRLREHTKSLEAAENLLVNDFRCRHLVVVPVWISLAERFLISHFHPIWNTIIDGFGNHDPGKGRRDMRRPRWDILHPGRPWAARLEAAETSDAIIADLQQKQIGQD